MEGRIGEGKRSGKGDGRGKGGSWGNSALVVWGIDAPVCYKPLTADCESLTVLSVKFKNISAVSDYLTAVVQQIHNK